MGSTGIAKNLERENERVPLGLLAKRNRDMSEHRALSLMIELVFRQKISRHRSQLSLC